jgi:hypothetical protein
VKEGKPSLPLRLLGARSPHVLANAAFADAEAKLEQLPISDSRPPSGSSGQPPRLLAALCRLRAAICAATAI